MKSRGNLSDEVVEIRKQAEESLREMQAILSVAPDNSQVGIAIVDAGSGALRVYGDVHKNIN
jgi:hypothetical protein